MSGHPDVESEHVSLGSTTNNPGVVDISWLLKLECMIPIGCAGTAHQRKVWLRSMK
jgi:hypothetical protein